MADHSANGSSGGGIAKNTVKSLLECWHLSYKYAIQEYPLVANKKTQVHVIFSKPTPELPSPLAVAHFEFYLEPNLMQVTGFTIENEQHFRSILETKFEEKLIDQVIHRKLHLKTSNRIDLQDEFTRSRIPRPQEQIDLERRHKHREMLEEMLLEALQRKDIKNRGKIPFVDVYHVLYGLNLGISHEERLVLFALVDQDRDELVDYSRFPGVMVQMIDTMIFAPETCDTDTLNSREINEMLDVLQHNEIEYNLQVLRESFEQKVKATNHVPPPTVETPDAANNGATSGDQAAAPSNEAIESTPSEEKTTAAAPSPLSPERKEDHEKPSSVEEVELDDQKLAGLSITKHQFRQCLESTDLVVSKAEFNLLLAFGGFEGDPHSIGVSVDATSGSEAKSGPSPFGPDVRFLTVAKLLRRVGRQIFHFQLKAFRDDLPGFLLTTCRHFERGQLQGSSEHLKGKIPIHKFKMVLRDCQKLLVSPFQMHQMVILAHESLVDGHGVAKGGSTTHGLVDYNLLVPEMSRLLQQQVDWEVLRRRCQWLKSHASEWLVDASSSTWRQTLKITKDKVLSEFVAADPRHTGFLTREEIKESLWHLRTMLHVDQVHHVDQLSLILDEATSTNTTSKEHQLHYGVLAQVVGVYARYLATQRALAQL